jgi:hypothetical protein
MPAFKAAAWDKAKAGDTRAQQVCEAAKRWKDIYENWGRKKVSDLIVSTL